MAGKNRRRVIRRKPEVEEVEEVLTDEDELDLDAEELEISDDDIEWEEDDEEEEVVVAPARTARRVKPAVKTTVKPAPAPVAKAKVAKAAAAPVDGDEDDEEVVAPKAKAKIRKVDTVVAENVLTQILEGMETGKTVAISRTGENRWELALVDGKSFAATGKLSGKAYWDEVISPEFTEWSAEWSQMTFDEKKKAATKAGVTWEPNKNPKIEVIRITAAYREHLGIEKYKPQYQDRSARAAIKG